ncbi:hypothetical protein AB0D08_06565 [Kitasatospora sp. NPDC048540]|uniref:hypothetical protein n=1 Tax=Kitasatospora sp. NPDC048540 TaxID=3155634 RepID=UPI0033DDA386
MTFTDGQLSSLAAFAEQRRERERSAPVAAAVMLERLAAGEAELLGDFQGAPVKYLDRWWRAGEGVWEPLDEAAGKALDDDAARWKLALAAEADAFGGVESEDLGQVDGL